MSTQPPDGASPLPPPGSLRCPRCSATVGADQDWCLECGAPARTRLAPTPNWQLPTVAMAAIVLLAGALLAFAFVDLTGDDGAAAGTTPTAVVETVPPAAVVPPPVVAPTATSTAPVEPAAPATVPGQPTTATVPVPTTVPATATVAPATTSTPSTTGTTATTTATTKP